jgi:hypothetical protein
MEYTEYTYDEKIVSDLHKDAYGFRPSAEFSILWGCSSNDQKQKIWDSLLAALEQSITEEEEAEALRVGAFEARIEDAIQAGANDRKAAIRQVVESLNLTEVELCYGGDYACFQLGLPYAYGKELDEVIDSL